MFIQAICSEVSCPEAPIHCRAREKSSSLTGYWSELDHSSLPEVSVTLNIYEKCSICLIFADTRDRSFSWNGFSWSTKYHVRPGEQILETAAWEFISGACNKTWWVCMCPSGFYNTPVSSASNFSRRAFFWWFPYELPMFYTFVFRFSNFA